MRRSPLIVLLIAVLAIGAWSAQSNRDPARGRPPGVTPTGDGRGAAAFCALVLTRPDLAPQVGAAYGSSGETSYPLLVSLALQWGADGSAGAREQVAVECRREGLGR